jgi:hypothetical protein
MWQNWFLWCKSMSLTLSFTLGFLRLTFSLVYWLIEATIGLIAKLDVQFLEQAILDVMGVIVPNVGYKWMQRWHSLDIWRFWRDFIAPHVFVDNLGMFPWFFIFFQHGSWMFNKVFSSWQWSLMLLKPWLKLWPLQRTRLTQSL